MLPHIGDGLAKTGVRFHLPLFYLFIEPLLEPIDDRAALGLMEGEALLG